MFQVRINGQDFTVPKGTSVLEACQSAGVFVPTLCAHPDIPPAGKCGICVVKINGNNYTLACSTKVQPGMTIETNTSDVKKRASDALNAFNDMPLMPPSKELEDMYKYFNPKRPIRGRKAEKTNAINFDPTQCVNCGRCVRACGDVQCIGALDEESHSLNDNDCIGCGMCTTVCPTDALTSNSSIPAVIRAMAAGKILVLQIAPSVRVSIGECFGDPIGTICTKKLIGAAREMGFRYVFDINFGADVTIVEEATELLRRLDSKENLPMFTSCCPAWVNFVEKLHPELVPNLSTSKSPHMMSGILIKNYFATMKDIDPVKMFVVSLMPCTAKKDEIQRKQLQGTVDAVLTTCEFADLMKDFDISWEHIKESEFDDILGESTGAAQLFGASGGVMEAAIRYCHEEITHEKLGDVKYEMFRETKDIKSSKIQIGDKTINVAVCNGIAAAREFVEDGTFKEFDFIEVMACPGGCVGGGGQPKLSSRAKIKERTKAIFSIDENSTEKTAKDNKQLKDFYDKFLGSPYGDISHNLLHTVYHEQNTPLIEMKRKIGTLPIVAFGSSSGTASRFARTFASYIGTVPVQLNMVSLATLQKRISLIIFCSTFGDGEFPSNAQKFVQMLRETKETFPDLKYAICALGSRDYQKYCACGHILDKLLMQKGARRFMSMAELDSSSPDRGECTFEAWSPDCITKLGLKMPEVRVQIQYHFTVTKNPEDVIHKHPEKPIGYDYGSIVSSTIMTPEGFEPQMHRYQIKLPAGMSYEAGDLVAILPHNDDDTVNAVLSELGLDGDDILNVETTLPEGYNIIPSRVTVRQLFSQYLDLNGIPNRNLLRAYRQCSKDQFSKERFDRILNPADPRFFDDLVKDTSVGEFILEYARHGSPSLDILVSAIPHIWPRLYCIASAPTGTSRVIDLLVSDNIFGPGNSRHGLSTSFLRKFGLTKIAVKTQHGCLKYPKDPTTPIIMAALGCGVAPMLSLLQHRESLDGDMGKCALFLGCRFKNTYPILDTMLQTYLEQGSLQDLFYAYSREGTTKTFITDKIAEKADIVWSYWQNPKTIFVYCGPPRGIPEKIRLIFIRISMEKGGMTREEAEKFCAMHPHFIESF